MAGSAKPKRYPHRPRGGTDPSFYYPSTAHDAEDQLFELDPTRVECAAYAKSLTPP